MRCQGEVRGCRRASKSGCNMGGLGVVEEKEWWGSVICEMVKRRELGEVGGSVTGDGDRGGGWGGKRGIREGGGR